MCKIGCISSVVDLHSIGVWDGVDTRLSKMAILLFFLAKSLGTP